MLRIICSAQYASHNAPCRLRALDRNPHTRSRTRPTHLATFPLVAPGFPIIHKDLLLLTITYSCLPSLSGPFCEGVRLLFGSPLLVLFPAALFAVPLTLVLVATGFGLCHYPLSSSKMPRIGGFILWCAWFRPDFSSGPIPPIRDDDPAYRSGNRPFDSLLGETANNP